jgi:hypothetical protein
MNVEGYLEWGEYTVVVRIWKLFISNPGRSRNSAETADGAVYAEEIPLGISVLLSIVFLGLYSDYLLCQQLHLF